VFVVGGATYAEAKELSAMKNVLLGSTTMLSSGSFLKGIAQLSEMRRNDTMVNFEIDQ
jgi:hypothetical protein